MRERRLVEEMSELAVELIVAVVDHAQEAVLDTKRVRVVVVELVAPDLDAPTFEVLAVEELDPAVVRAIHRPRARGGEGTKERQSGARPDP